MDDGARFPKGFLNAADLHGYAACLSQLVSPSFDLHGVNVDRGTFLAVLASRDPELAHRARELFAAGDALKHHLQHRLELADPLDGAPLSVNPSGFLL